MNKSENKAHECGDINRNEQKLHECNSTNFIQVNNPEDFDGCCKGTKPDVSHEGCCKGTKPDDFV